MTDGRSDSGEPNAQPSLPSSAVTVKSAWRTSCSRPGWVWPSVSRTVLDLWVKTRTVMFSMRIRRTPRLDVLDSCPCPYFCLMTFDLGVSGPAETKHGWHRRGRHRQA